MKGFLYFVGRPYPYPEAIDKIREQGYKVGIFLDQEIRLRHPELFDLVINTDFSNNKTLLKSIPQDFQVDGLICNYENYIVSKSLLADKLRVNSLSHESALKCTDKLSMRQSFKQANSAMTPKFGFIDSLQKANDLATSLGYPVILKPTNLVKSLLVLRCNNEKELGTNFEFAKAKIGELYKKNRVYNRQPQFILEEYIQGRTCSIAAFVDKSGKAHICEGIVSLTNAQDVGINDNFIYSRTLPGNFSHNLKNSLMDVSLAGIKALGMTSSPAHVELIYNKEGVKIIEIGARIGGYRPRMYELSYGNDLIQQEINLALGHQPVLKGKFKAYSAVYELFPNKEGRFKELIGTSNTHRFTKFTLTAKPGDMVGPAKMGYKAAAIITISGQNEADFKFLAKEVSKLKILTS